MKAARIYTSICHPHSTRAAATSKAKAACVPIQEILNTAGWSSSKTFDRFYNKPASNELTFANLLLKKDLENLFGELCLFSYTLSYF